MADKKTNPRLEIDKFKTRKDIYTFIKRQIKSNNTYFGENNFNEIKNSFDTAIDTGKAKFYKAYHKTVSETSDPASVTSRSTVLAIKFTVVYDDDHFNSDDEVNIYADSLLKYLKTNFDVLYASVDRITKTIYVVSTAIVKRFYYPPKLNELLQKGMLEEDLYGILSYSHILTSSQKRKTKGGKIKSDTIDTFSILQEEYYMQVLKPLGFSRRKLEPKKVRLTESEANKIQEEYANLLYKIDVKDGELNVLRDKIIRLEKENSSLNKIKTANNINDIQLKEYIRYRDMCNDIINFAKNKHLDELNEVFRKYYKDDIIIKSKVNKNDNYELLQIYKNTLDVLALDIDNWDYLIYKVYSDINKYNPTNKKILSIEFLKELSKKE
ncbi:hypothetical protein ACV3SI_14915 [Clostridium perfringens]